MLHHGAGLRTILERDGVGAAERDALLAALTVDHAGAVDHARADPAPADRAMRDYARADQASVDRAMHDYARAKLAPADRAMLDYAVKLTRAPWAIGEADVDALREAGFGDRAIHDICAITAYFAFVNRIADGLGVELEERFGG